MCTDVDVVVVVDFDGNLDLKVVSTVDDCASNQDRRMPISMHAQLSAPRVHQRTIEFLALAIEIVEELPRGHSEQADGVVSMLTKML